MSELKTIKIQELECQRCHRKFFPILLMNGEIKITERCRHRDCSSPYWNKPRERVDDYWHKMNPKRYRVGKKK